MASRSIYRIKPRISRPEVFISQSSRSLHTSQRCYAIQSDSNPVKQDGLSQVAEKILEQGRDPRLPPKPPTGTYPHPFLDSRDDPHSNSMRPHYQHPATIRTNPMSTNTGPDRYSSMNALFGTSQTYGTTEEILDRTMTTPIYVIHVKCSSNNTIISVHAPSTPKPRATAPTKSKISRGSSPAISAAPSSSAAEGETEAVDTATFSVQSNPDAAPENPEDRALKESKSTAVVAKALVTPGADHCFGWASGGSCHYKKVNRSTYEAGYAASVRIIRRIEEAFQHVADGRRIEDLSPMKELKPGTIVAPEPLANPMQDARGIMRIRVVYSGFGTGREAFNAAVLSSEGAFVRGLIGQVMDKTPVKIGGCRGRKTRRV